MTYLKLLLQIPGSNELMTWNTKPFLLDDDGRQLAVFPLHVIISYDIFALTDIVMYQNTTRCTEVDYMAGA